jgi:hypothetical protein
MTGALDSAFWHVVDPWLAIKMSLEQSLPFSSGWLHLVIGPLVFVAAAAVLKKPLTSWLPWLVLAVLAILNEIADLVPHRWPESPKLFVESGRDFFLSMVVSTAILVVARYRLRRKRATIAPEHPKGASGRGHCERQEQGEAPVEAIPD